ncbi:hypothetical protein HPP92_024879 [Vanilla planifolia]|uniref:Uncharacterized protein n=1 Tax=Vanilla planifolia TaxID=51239 RepID=A0A835UBK6_VANPL|nr:hypothetical protein HPP92_024879 [Vanilla planifolia]
MSQLTVEIEDTFANVLELAANNDLDEFKRFVGQNPVAIDEVGDWYGRKKVIEQRTPLMVAATYGSLDVLRFIINHSSADVNRFCGIDKTTALHCAASGGSLNAIEAVKSFFLLVLIGTVLMLMAIDQLMLLLPLTNSLM